MATKKAAEKQTLKPINRQLVTVRIVGISPLITHKWSEKAKAMMRDKQQTGKKTKARDLRDPEQEGKDATYYTEDGKPGLLAVAIKAAVIEAAHNDLGIPKTLVRKALFIYPMGRDVVIPIEHPTGGPAKKSQAKKALAGVGGGDDSSFLSEFRVVEEDMVRVGQGTADLRYRPYYYEWAATTQWELDIDQLQVADFLTLLDRAGYGVGVHEWRPEKGGEFGRFKIDDGFKVKVEPVK